MEFLFVLTICYVYGQILYVKFQIYNIKISFFIIILKISIIKKLAIENIVYKLTKLYISIDWKAILTLIIIDAIVNIFYKAICTVKLEFILAIANFFITFCSEIMVFLFLIMYYRINKSLDIKKLYIVYILIYNIISFVNANNRFIYIDFQAVIQLEYRKKKADYYEI